MEETIYKILESKVKLLTYTSREAYTKEAAEEISSIHYTSSLIYEFMEWVKTTCEVEDSNLWYYPYKDLTFSTSKELYKYWLKNIRQ
jgi:hypothetical protein